MNTYSRNLLRVTGFFLLLFAAFTGVHAQIEGTVTDATTHQPVAGAAVYINNTTYGSQADAKGRFSLAHFPAPPYQLAVSSIGYKTATCNVTTQENTTIHIELIPRVQNLDEIVVLAPEKDGWALYGQDFIRNFIGYSAFAKECELLNKEMIEFRDDRQHHKLLVTAREPLRIKNKATGYLITYWLDDYENDYLTHKLFFRGYAQFETLTSKKKKTNERWNYNRLSAYHGSIQQFMRAVYHNTVTEDGFEIRVLKKVTANEYGRYVPIRKDTINTLSDSLIQRIVKLYLNYNKNEVPIWSTLLTEWSKDTNATMPMTINGVNDDSIVNKKLVIKKNPQRRNELWVQYFDFNFVPVDSIALKMAASKMFPNKDSTLIKLPKRTRVLYQVLWKEKVPADSFVTRNDKEVRFQFKDFLQIAYPGEKEEPEYLAAQTFRNNQRPAPGIQKSIISVSDPETGILISPDGNYSDSYDLITEEYWSYEKMDKLLPLDYKP